MQSNNNGVKKVTCFQFYLQQSDLGSDKYSQWGAYFGTGSLIELRRFSVFSVKSRNPALTDLKSSIAADRLLGFVVNFSEPQGVNELFRPMLTVDPTIGKVRSGTRRCLAGGSSSREGKADRGGSLVGRDCACKIAYH